MLQFAGLRRVCFGVFLFKSALSSQVALAQSEMKIADGQVLVIENSDVTIVPPKGWEYRSPHLGKALVAQAPAGPIVYDKTVYQRNITLALLQEPRPIDKQEVKQPADKLLNEFGQAPGVSQFQVVEQRLTDHRSKQDAILVYTHFLLNGTPMSQMNVFISGAEKAALLTYTDLADEFQKNEAAMTEAWNALMSTEIKGIAPQRFAEFYPLAAGLGFLLLAFLSFVILRRRAALRMLEGAEGGLYDDNDSWTSDIAEISSFADESAPLTMASDVWGQATQVAMTEPKLKRKKQKLINTLQTSGF